MNWFAVYETTTGRLESIGSVEPAGLPAGLAYKNVGTERPSGAWNTSTLVFDPVTPEVVLEPIEFLRLFTMQERIAIRTARATDPVIEDFMDMLSRVKFVHLSHPDTIAGIGYMQQQGLLTAARATAVLVGEAPNG